jgi:hypothetical protein
MTEWGRIERPCILEFANKKKLSLEDAFSKCLKKIKEKFNAITKGE